ncbi:MAG: glycosyltransferase family 4 protein [Candidatus Woykebacteria bacterium]
MKILIITHYFSPHVGGIEIVAYNQAKELAKKGYKVTIVTSKLHDEKNEDEFNGIKIIRVKAWNWLEEKFDIPFPIFSPKLLLVLNREIRKTDIVHAHGILYFGSFIGSFFAKFNNKLFFVTEHVGLVPYKSKLANNIQSVSFATLGRLTLSLSKNIFILNENVAKYLQNFSNKSFISLCNGIDTKLFAPASSRTRLMLREKYNLPKDKPLILFVGRFVQKKGIDLIVNSINQAYSYVFIGRGEFPKETKRKNIHLFFSLNQKEMSEFYQACDIFLLPSAGEGFPLSIQEAMSSELPIITTQENIPLANNEQLAFYIALKSSDIKLAVKKLLNNKNLRDKLASNSRKIALKEFSWSKHVEKLLATYKRYE